MPPISDEIINDFTLQDDLSDDDYENFIKCAKKLLSSARYVGLRELCENISNQFKIQLSTADVCAIEEECINFCMFKWHEETIEFLKRYVTVSKIDIITVLCEIYTFADISKSNYEAFRHLKSTKYFKYLVDNRSLVGDDKESRLITDVKLFVYSHIKTLESSLKLEFDFYDHFMNILLESDENFTKIVAKFQLKSLSSLRNLLNVIIRVSDEQYSDLQLIAKQLLKVASYKFDNEIIKSINDYIKPPTINTVQKDNRLVIEVIGRHLIFSGIKDRIESLLTSNQNIEEIRFVGARVFCVNASISHTIWHSKNFAIFAEKVKVVGSGIEWDVSGYDSTRNFNSNAGTKSNGDGAIGNDGTAGESGGNVLIIATMFVNSSNWTIKSHGGQGSNGQDGGDGIDGEDGEGMKVGDFKKFIGSKDSCKKYWNGRVIGSWSNGKDWNGEWHLEFELKSGKRITEIIDQGYYLFYCYVHEMCLVKGTAGNAGGDGGAGGFGGEGGYCGQIDIFQNNCATKTSVAKGKQGENGKQGLNGVRGIDGHDVGHYTTITESHSYYGEDANSKYKIEYYSNRDGKRVCSYRYRNDTYKYAGIAYNGRIEKKKAKFERNTQRNVRERSSIAKAVKRKTINAKIFKNAYEHLFKSPIDKSIQAIKINENELVKLREKNEEEIKSEIKESIKHRRIFAANVRNKFRKRHVKVVNEEKVAQTFDFKSVPKDVASTVKYIRSLEISTVEDIKTVRRILLNYATNNGFVHVDSLDELRFKKYQIEVITNFFKHFASDNLRDRELCLKNEQKLKIYAEAFELGIRKLPKLFELYRNSQKYLWMAKDLENRLSSGEKNRLLSVLYRNLKNETKDYEEIETYITVLDTLDNFSKFITKNLPVTSSQLFSGIKLQDYGFKVLLEKQKSLELAEVFRNIQNESRNTNLIKKFNPHCFKITKFQDDKTQHGKLGRLFQYFVNDFKETRKQIIAIVEEYFDKFSLEKKPTQRQKFYLSKASKYNKNDIDIDELKYINRLLKSSILRFLQQLEDEKREVDDDIQKIINAYKNVKRISKLNNDSSHYESWIDRNVAGNEIHSLILCFKRDFKRISTDKIVTQALYSKSVRKEFIKNINYNGTQSATYIDLLAHLFDVNIQVYDQNDVKVKENFNGNGENVIYLCQRNEVYEKIEIDEKYSQLWDKQEENVDIFTKVFRDFTQLNTLNDLRMYVDSKEYLKYSDLQNKDYYEGDEEYDENPEEENKPKKFRCELDRVLQAIYPKKGKLDVYERELARNFIPRMNLLKHKQIPKILRSQSVPNLCKINEKTVKADVKKLPTLSDDFFIDLVMKYFNYDSMKNQLFGRLQLISSSVVKSPDILQTIATKFHIDGVHISIDELVVCIDIILNRFHQTDSFPGSCLIVVATEPQENWILKLLVMRIETFLKKEVSREKFLSNLKETNRKLLVLLARKLLCSNETCSESNLLEITKLLQYASESSVEPLSDLKLDSWKYFGIQEYYKSLLKNLYFTEQQRDKLQFYLIQMQCIFGSEIIVEFVEMLVWKRAALPDGEKLIKMFENFYNSRWQLNTSTLNILRSQPASMWIELLDEHFSCTSDERNISDIIKIVKFSSLISNEVKTKLNLLEKCVIRTFASKYLKFTRRDIQEWIKRCHKYKLSNFSFYELLDDYLEPTNDELLAVIMRAIMLATNDKVKLRPTQLFAILVMIESNKNVMAQISTGEGKSWIAVGFAIMKVFRNENIDIITSNKILAERDATKPEHIDVFSMFNIRVGHNCDENESTRRQVYSSCNVVYGDLPNFQRDYLLETFYGRNIFGDRRFQNVLIDEVDSMLLDKGNNILYLSHNLPHMDELKPLYIYILQFITQKVANEEQLKYIWNKNVIKCAVYREFFKMIDQNDFREYFSDLTDFQINKLWHILVDNKIIKDREGFLLNGKFNENCRVELETSFFQMHIERLRFLLSKHSSRRSDYIIPAHLLSFVLLHIDTLIENALRAVQMINKREFIVDVDKSGTSSDVHPEIIIQDLDTGSDLWNSEFDEGLNQFLQLLHGCKLTEQSLKAVFISNVSYFKIYSNVYGMTGTLGTKNERDKLNEIHDTDFVIIPQYKVRKFYEDETKLCFNYDEWMDFISAEVKKKREKEKRSVLIICETIHDVEKIKERLSVSKENLIVYDRSFDKPEIDNLSSERVIIATNIAGRGTDITITEKLALCGGLHVIITFLPNNIRIEQQAFGRAARCGMRGSGRLIINCSSCDSVTNLLELKQIRDENELKRIDQVCEFFRNTIKFEESLFQSFKMAFSSYQIDNSKSFVSSIPLIGSTIENLLPEDKVKKEKNKYVEIVRKSFLDSWSLWLDKNNEEITRNDKPVEKLEELLTSLNAIARDYIYLTEDNISHWVESKNVSPVAMVNFIKLLAEKNRKNDILSINREAVKRCPDDLATIYMNCFSKSKELSSLKNFHNNDCVLETLIAVEKRKDREFFNHMMVKNVQSRNIENLTELKAAKEQHDRCIRVYDIFIDSLMQIRGYNITPDSFTDIVSNNSLIAETVYEDLLKHNIITKPNFQVRDFMKPLCEEIATDYFIDPRKLWTFLNDHRNTTYNSFDDIEALLKQKISMPAVEEFWTILKKNKKVIDVEVIVTIDADRLEMFDKNLYAKINTLKQGNSIGGIIEGKISLYSLVAKDEKRKSDGDETKLEFFERTLLQHIDRNCFNQLIEKKIVDFNEIGTITRSKVEFPKFCRITKAHFNILQINDDDLQEILKILINNSVLIKSSGEFSLNLNVFSNEDDGVMKLGKFDMYEPHIRRFLNILCSYPMALLKLEKQIFKTTAIEDAKLAKFVTTNSKDFIPFVSLPSRPHRRLMGDLITNHFIEQPKLNHDKYDNIESEIEKLYQTSILTDDFLLSLFTIFAANPIAIPFHLASINSVSLSSKNKVLNENCKEIANVLKSSASSIKTKEEPVTDLRNLTEYFKENEITNETNAFITKGLDSVIIIDEKKWTPKVIFGLIFVLIAGIVQFIVGTIMMISSLGLMYHVASGLVQEGISDLFFAFSVYRSGRFTWTGYLNHKWQSLCFTVACCGISYFFSNAMNSTILGQKLFGPDVVKNGVELGKLQGWALLKEVGARQVMSVAFRAMVKQGIKVGIKQGVQYTYRALLERRMKSMIEGLVQSIQTDVYSKISESSLNGKFTALYTKVGSVKAAKIIDRAITEALKKNPAKELYKILDGVMTINDKFLEVCSKNPNELNNELLDVAKMMSIMLKLYQGSVIFLEISAFSTAVIKSIDDNLAKEMKTLIADRSIKETQKLDVFLNSSIVKVEKKINEHISNVVNDKIITPLANLFLNKLARQIESRGTKFVQKNWNARKERKIREKVVKTIDDLKTLNEHDPSQRAEIKVLKENLVNLMQKTKSPGAVAMIIRQDVPMNLVAVKASLPVINQAIRLIGGNEIRFKINTGEYTYEIGNKSAKLVTLNLDDGHYGDGTNDDNNCYFQELCKQIPELNNISPETFRSRIADVIEIDPRIRFEVEQGWHNYSMGIGFSGGAKKEIPKTKTDLTAKQIKECEKLFDQCKTYDFDGEKDSHMKYKYEKEYGDKNLSDLERSNVQRIMALRKGLEIINNDLIKKGLIDRNSPITFADMTATCYAKIKVNKRYGPDNMDGRIEEAFYPVEMEFVAKDGGRYEINMDNPFIADTSNGPNIPHIGYSIPGEGSQIDGHIFFEATGNEPTRMKNNLRLVRSNLYVGERFVPMENFDNFSSNIDLRMYDDNCNFDATRLPRYQSHKYFRDFKQ